MVWTQARNFFGLPEGPKSCPERKFAPPGYFARKWGQKLPNKGSKKAIFPVNFRFISEKIPNNDPKSGHMGWYRDRNFFGLPGGAKGCPERKLAPYGAILPGNMVKNSPETGPKMRFYPLILGFSAKKIPNNDPKLG